MKKMILYVIVFMVGVYLGRATVSQTTKNISKIEEKKELIKWEDIKKSRLETAKKYINEPRLYLPTLILLKNTIMKFALNHGEQFLIIAGLMFITKKVSF